MNQIQKSLALVDDYDLPGVIEKSISAGSVRKADVTELIERRVLARKRDTESIEQAFVRVAVESGDPVTGKLYRQAAQMRGRDHHAEAALQALTKSDTAAAAPAPAAATYGVEYDLLCAMAQQHRASNPELTFEQAFAAICSTPTGVAWLREHRQANLRKALAAQASAA